ncbi:MAG: aminotransferase class III-fold pyridoxal phosphate-dependent enzyme [Proteobacteria bacterium]|nr:aminotransferase class III-fold pyridoxal phosphate-dependent enzyme [Pseudomonadota bacterium]
MTHVFQRRIHADPPRAKKGDGVYIIDADGKRYLDASGGAAVSCLGHSDADVIQAIKDQTERLPFAHPVVRVGNVYEEILKLAGEISCDLIVMASHQPKLEDYLLGPNAARVVRHATCSVLVVRE